MEKCIINTCRKKKKKKKFWRSTLPKSDFEAKQKKKLEINLNIVMVHVMTFDLYGMISLR